MAIITTYDFATPADYTYDNSLVEVSDGARLTSPYSVDKPSIKPSSITHVEGIHSLAASTNTPDGTEVRWTVEVDGVEMYWNDVEQLWKVYTGWDVAMTLAQLNAHLDLLVTSYKRVRFVAYLGSDGNSTPSISSVTMSTNFHSQNPSSARSTVVYGWLYGPDGQPLQGVRVTAKLSDYGSYGSDKLRVSKMQVYRVTDDDGYWDMELFDTANMTPNTLKFLFSFYGKGFDIRNEVKSVTVATTVNYKDLT